MFDIKNISMIEYTQVIGEHKFKYVALFNDTRTTEQEARHVIKTNTLGSKDVIIISKEQYINVFMSDGNYAV